MPILSDLNEREKAILKLVAQGYNNKEIAFKAGIDYRIVGNIIGTIYSKLNLNLWGTARVRLAMMVWEQEDFDKLKARVEKDGFISLEVSKDEREPVPESNEK